MCIKADNNRAMFTYPDSDWHVCLQSQDQILKSNFPAILTKLLWCSVGGTQLCAAPRTPTWPTQNRDFLYTVFLVTKFKRGAIKPKIGNFHLSLHLYKISVFI